MTTTDPKEEIDTKTTGVTEREMKAFMLDFKSDMNKDREPMDLLGTRAGNPTVPS